MSPEITVSPIIGLMARIFVLGGNILIAAVILWLAFCMRSALTHRTYEESGASREAPFNRRERR